MTHRVAARVDQSSTKLIAELYPQLRAFASVVAPAHEDPNDLIQEALVRALRGGPLSRLEHPKAYLKTAIYHLAISARRHWVAEQRGLVRIAAEVDTAAVPWQVDELLRLPPRERAVLYLHIIEGLPYAEVGRLLDCTEMSARKAASRGKHRLRRLLVEEGDDASA